MGKLLDFVNDKVEILDLTATAVMVVVEFRDKQSSLALYPGDEGRAVFETVDDEFELLTATFEGNTLTMYRTSSEIDVVKIVAVPISKFVPIQTTPEVVVEEVANPVMSLASQDIVLTGITLSDSDDFYAVPGVKAGSAATATFSGSMSTSFGGWQASINPRSDVFSENGVFSGSGKSSCGGTFGFSLSVEDGGISFSPYMSGSFPIDECGSTYCGNDTLGSAGVTISKITIAAGQVFQQGSIIYATDVASVVSEINTEAARRDNVGAVSARASNPSQGSIIYAGNASIAGSYANIAQPLLEIDSSKITLPTASSTGIMAVGVGSYSVLSDVCATFRSYPEHGNSSGCASSCTGLCAGCSGTCQGSCRGSCSGGCSGSCSGSCGSYSSGCSGDCTYGVGSDECC